MRTSIALSLTLVLAAVACSSPKSPNDAKPETSTTTTTSSIDPTFDEGITRAPPANPAPLDPTIKPGVDRMQTQSGEARQPLYREPREGLQDQVKQPTAPMETLDDGRILAVVMAANASEVDLATLAKQKATNKDVKEFAGLMFTQHTDAQQKAKSVESKSKLTPADSKTSKKVKDDGLNTMAMLRDHASGSEFDRMYMSAMVKSHQDLLTTIDGQLVPNATNGELKNYLTSVRQRVLMHLTRAREIQNALGSGASSSAAGRTYAMTPAPRY